MTAGRDAAGEDRWIEALSWYSALRGADKAELTIGLWREWKAWYGDPANRQIFEAVSRLLAERSHFRDRERPGSSELQEDRYDPCIPIAAWRRAQSLAQTPGRRPSSRRRWWLLSGLGLAAVAVVVAVRPLALDGGGGKMVARTYRTDVGGIEAVQLADGSSITLGGRTTVSVEFSPGLRAVRLIGGEAWFKVAHDPAWPFKVVAGDGTITAVGTAFLVTRYSDRVVVTVTDGTVEVSSTPAAWPPRWALRRVTVRSALKPIPVSRGQELTFGDGGVLRAIAPASPKDATAWTRGRLTFDNQPLQYVVETVNRYSSQRIVVSPAVGALRFSGILSEMDIDAWLKSIEVILPVTVQKQGSVVHVRMRLQMPASR